MIGRRRPRPVRIITPLLATIVLGILQLVALAASPAQAATTITLSPLATGFNNPIAVDYHEPSNSLLLSVNYSSGQPNNFDLVASDGSHSQFSAVHGLTNEVYMTTVRTSACQGGFTVGQTFVGTGAPGVIDRLSPDGSVLTSPWVVLPGESGLLRGGLFQDRYCSFGGDLIATTDSGNVWRVTSAGAPTLVKSGVGSVLEGPTTVPNDPARYGPWAGTILAGDEANGCVYSISAAGAATCTRFGGDPESIRVIPAGENFFGVDFARGTLVGGAASQFAGIVGDLLVANENGVLLHVTYNGTTFVSEQVAKVAQFEGTAFAPVTLPTALTLSPPTATNVIGTSHTVTANVTFAGVPQAGQTLTFRVDSGPNAGRTGTAVTDANGNASFTYSDTGGLGTDTISVTWIDRFGGTETATATKTWVKATPRISTTPSGSVPAGGNVSDSATVAGGLSPSGTVTFSLFGPGDTTCATSLTTRTAALSGGSASSGNVLAATAGTYSWVATYNGDANNNSVTSGCGDESVNVTRAVTALATTPSSSVPAGGRVSDAATLTGGSAPTGTITFRLFGPGDTTCATPVVTRTATVAGNGTYGSGDVVAASAGTYNWTAAYTGDANNNASASGCGTEMVVVTPQTLTGRAFGLSARTAVLTLAPTPDTGSISTTAAGSTSTPCVASIGGAVTAHTVCVNVTTTQNPASSSARATVADATVGLPLLPVIQTTDVRATSSTTCSGSTGQSTIGFLRVGGTVVLPALTSPAPDTTVNVGLVKLVLNEQVPVPGGLTVNAVHITVVGGPDVIIASATSDIHNCP